MTIHHSTIQRLAFSKYLYSLAIEQSKAPDLMASSSLLTFHDSIEFFLQISAEHLNVGKKQLNFMEYWDFCSKKLTITELPYKESMRRLNKARVALKHNGTLPSKLDIESFRATTTLFFEEVTKLVFGLEFTQISLIEYVSPKEARDHLKKSEELCLTENFVDAATEIALSFEKIISTYENSKCEWFTESPFFFGSEMRNLKSNRLGVNKQDFSGLAEFIDKVSSSMETMQAAMKILALGLDYRKYSKFKRLLPTILWMSSGEYVSQIGIRQKEALDKEYIDFCVNYIIESSIKLNEFDYEIEKRNRS